ncbi:MAG: hypothetical protein J5874_03350 [Oscillospiraceae bacterium]|nr:hypothetical protein [Oscillospiraceae bacterium]
MKKMFTPVELMIVVVCLALLAALMLGAASRSSAREAHCADKLRNLLKISHQYVTDHRGMWMAPCNTKNGAYVRALSQGRYLKSSWRTLMTARETEITCPELPRVPRYPTMQGYGAIYNNGSSYDPQVGIYIYSPEYAFTGTGKGRRQVAWAKRIWFADSLNLLKPPYPSPLLFGTHAAYPKGAEVFGAVNLILRRERKEQIA